MGRATLSSVQTTVPSVRMAHGCSEMSSKRLSTIAAGPFPDAESVLNPFCGGTTPDTTLGHPLPRKEAQSEVHPPVGGVA